MSKPHLASIFNLEFYRKQNKWRFAREAVTEQSPAPECSKSARALLNQTYNVDVQAELPVPSALDEAFIDSANGADPSSDTGGEGDLLSEDSEPSGHNDHPEAPDPEVKSWPGLYQYPDNVTDYPHCDIGCGLRMESPQCWPLGPETPPHQHQGRRCSRPPEQYFADAVPPLTLSEMKDDGWHRDLLRPAEECRDELRQAECRDGIWPGDCRGALKPGVFRGGHWPEGFRGGLEPGEFRGALEPGEFRGGHWPEGFRGGLEPGEFRGALEPGEFRGGLWPEGFRGGLQPEGCAEGWPSRSAVWTNAGQDDRSEHWMQACAEAARVLPEMVDFKEEEELLQLARRWLLLRRRAPRGGSPPLHRDRDCLDGVGYADDSLLLDSLTLRPRERLLARSPGGVSPGGVGPGGVSPGGDGLSPRGPSPDSAGFMLGAHAAPHSSEIELFSGESFDQCGGPLSARVDAHARALRQLLLMAQAQAQRPASRAATDVPSFEEFPTRDVGPGGPPPAPGGPPAGRGRGRWDGAPVVWVSAGRPYRL